MNNLDEKILSTVFGCIDDLNDLLRISCVCRDWRKLIIEKDFIQKRFIDRRCRYLVNHWKFDNIFNLGFNQTINTNKYFQKGFIQREKCFLGYCLVFDAHSSITIPLNNYQSEQFSISIWFQNTSSVNSWRTIFDISLFESKCGFIHVGITPQSTIEMSFSLYSNQKLIKCRSSKQNIIRYLWYHLVILISPDKQILFLNGQCQRESKRNFDKISMKMNELNIGRNSKGVDCWFGRIADFSIWNRSLDMMEIRAIWEQRKSIDKINLGEYLMMNLNTKQSNYFRSVLL